MACHTAVCWVTHIEPHSIPQRSLSTWEQDERISVVVIKTTSPNRLLIRLTMAAEYQDFWTKSFGSRQSSYTSLGVCVSVQHHFTINTYVVTYSSMKSLHIWRISKNVDDLHPFSDSLLHWDRTSHCSIMCTGHWADLIWLTRHYQYTAVYLAHSLADQPAVWINGVR